MLDPDREQSHPLIGTVIGGYRIVRKMAEGGMGIILEAKHTSLGQRAAVKILSQQLVADENYQEFYLRFINEAKAIGLIQHPGIVKVFDQGQLPDGTAYILMEYLDGESLAQRIARGSIGPDSTWIPVASVLRIARQLASALAEAHRKSIIHRDLKPGNVFLVPDSEAPGGERTKLLDFGIARFMDSGQKISRTGTQMGTPLYMSPEQCMGEKVDGKTDVYALGAMMFEMLSGRPPFNGPAPAIIVQHVNSSPPDLAELCPAVPKDVKALVERLMNKDAKQRPPMLQLLDELRQLERAHPGSPGDNDAALPTDPTRMLRDISATSEAATRITPPSKKRGSVGVSRTRWVLFGVVVLLFVVFVGFPVLYRFLMLKKN